MIDSSDFLNFLYANGFSFACGVPCSYFSRVINELTGFNGISYIPSTREDEAIGIASGIALGQNKAFVLMQNSGYATIGDALTSLAQLYKLPMLLIISYRGLEPDKDFPEHSLMGKITESTLDCYHMPYWNLEEDGWKVIIETALAELKETSKPVSLLVKQGVL